MRGWPVIAGGQAQRVVDAIPQEQLDALPLGRLDFIGMNIYNSVMVRAGENGKPEFCPEPQGTRAQPSAGPSPRVDGVGDTLCLGSGTVCLSILPRTAFPAPTASIWMARCMTSARIDFIHRYLLSLRRAIDSGVDVRGYFHWSLLDNFEWSEGL